MAHTLNTIESRDFLGREAPAKVPEAPFPARFSIHTAKRLADDASAIARAASGWMLIATFRLSSDKALDSGAKQVVHDCAKAAALEADRLARVAEELAALFQC
jgi:hypothetical protein